MSMEITPIENPTNSVVTITGSNLPGSFAIGSGYNIFDSYCLGTSLRRPLFNLGERKTDSLSGLETFEAITVQPGPSGIADRTEGSTLSEYSKAFALKAGLKGSYGAFEGDINVAFKTSEAAKVSTRFMKLDYQVYKWRLSLPTESHIAERLTRDAKDDLLHMKVTQLLRDYGTHYLATIMVGARLSYSFTADSTDFSSQSELEATAKMSYDWLTGSISGSLSVAQEKKLRTFNSNSHARAAIVGGDERLLQKILDGDFQGWLDSIPDRLAFSGMGGDSLVRISALIDDPERKAEVDAAIDAEESAHPLPDSPFIVPILAYNNMAKADGKTRSRWFYTASEMEAQPTGFGPMGVFFYAFNKEVEGTVPVWRFSAGSPERYMLSTNGTERAGWKDPVIAFHAFRNDKGDDSRLKINAFKSNLFEPTSGWYYTTDTKVGSWTHDASNDFFVPSVR